MAATGFRYAIRVLGRTPAFTVGVVAVLALGIGGTVSVFSAIDQTIVRPLPYRAPDRIAMLWEDFSAFGTPKTRVSPATFVDWKRRTRVFADLGAIRLASANLAESGAPEEVLGAAVTANVIPLVGVEPLMGRGPSVEEEAPGHRVVVLGEQLWRRRFGAVPNIVGRSVVMSGEPHTVIGVMPAGFHFPDARSEFWTPIALSPQQLTARNSHYLRVVGRLREGATWAAARDDMRAVAEQLAKEYPRTNERVGVTVTPLKDEVTADAGRALALLFGAAASVLLIACFNVTNLLLARAASRRREIAVRMALGASSARIVGQLLTESVLLSAAGAAAGLVIAYWTLGALTRFIPRALSTSIVLHLDLRALVFATTAAVVTALLFGAAPAAQLVSGAAMPDLKTFGAAAGSPASARFRRVLVVGEIAIALVLVASAALLVETLIRLRALDPGFRADHVLTAQISVPFPKYADAARRQRFFADVVDGVRRLPGVVGVGLTSDLPYTTRGNTMSVKIEHRETPALGRDVLFRLVSADYLPTVGATLRAGRFLNGSDSADAPPVVVVNDALAREYWPDGSPIGQRIDTGTGDGSPLWMTIVGVVEDIKERGVDYGSKPAVYVPFTQTKIAFFQPSEVAVRTAAAPQALATALQRVVWDIDREQPVSEIRTMDDIVDEELSGRQQMLSLVGVFAVVALLLAALGVYSVLSYLVSERRREIGVRLAIGADARVVQRDVLAQSARLAALGIALGLAASAVATRWLGSLLFGVSPLDPRVLGGVSVLLMLVALVASVIPARRAANVDPMLVLRSE